jgi:Ca2+-binding EF-hand superfamily protein
MKADLQARMANRQMQPQKSMRIDSDGDGLISLVEFTTHLPMFDHLDANEDGTITAEEAAQQSPPVRERGKKGNFQPRP